MRGRLLLCLLILCVLLPAQVTFTSTTQLVVETVSVTDKSGKPVDGLRAEDFQITENGVPQQIRVFEFQRLDGTQPLPAVPPAERIAPAPRLSRTQIAADKPGTARYRNRRLLALYFDFTAMPVADQLRAFEAAKSFVRTGMTASDMVAVMVFVSGALQVLEDFTSDRARLLRTIETLIVGEDENAPATEDDARSDTGAAFGQNDSEFNIFFTDRQLAALQTAASMLGRLNEKKSLIYFASGLRLNGANNQAQLHATINAAVRAGVSLWPVDARGLVAEAPLGDARRGSPGGLTMYTGAAANALINDRQRSQDTLWTLAADTGGKALLDSNDLREGILQAQRSIRSYYMLGYYTTNASADGKFRRVRIAVPDRPHLVLNFREGYYADKEYTRYTGADKERQLEDALMQENPITDITIALEVSYFQLNRAEYFVNVAAKLPGEELVQASGRGAERARVDFLAEVRDEYGTAITNVRDKVDIQLKGRLARDLAASPVDYDAGFTLLPGRYKLKFLARNFETGRIGTYETAFVVPNLNKEQARVPTSSVVLSAGPVRMADALFHASRDKAQKAQADNPLVDSGAKLVPSVTRVFSRKKDLHALVQVYALEAAGAYLSLYKDGNKIVETQPVFGNEAGGTRFPVQPLRLSVPLVQVPPGEYACQVTVVSPAGRKAAFWQAPVMVVP